MTIQLPLLISLIFYCISSYSQALPCDSKFNVLDKNTSGKYEVVLKNLPDLSCNGRFEGKYFKIVHKTDNEAIGFKANSDLSLRAANVYYHLSIARDFWVEKIQSDYVKNMKQIIVRLDITNSFSNMRHFKHEEQQKDFNNAWTIPEGETPSFVKDKKVWGKEIWFNPMKKIESRKNVKSKGGNPVHQSLKIIDEPVTEMQKNNLIYQGLSFMRTPTFTDSAFLTLAVRRVGVIAITKGLVAVTKHMDKFFVEKYYYLDTAMIPDVIYHEFAHVALSDTLKTTHSVPVIEGMADYFASRVFETKSMYKKIKKFSTNRSKKLRNNKMYHPFFEHSWHATSDYTLSLLWKAKDNLDEINRERILKNQPELVDFDQLVFKAHDYLTEKSNIMNDLTTELINACKTLCSNSRLGIGTLNISYEQKGLN